jgi:hypothetical protein
MKNKTETRELSILVSPKLKKELDSSPSKWGVTFKSLKKIKVALLNKSNPTQHRTLEYDEMVQRGLAFSNNEIDSTLNDMYEELKNEENPPSFDDLKNNATFDFIDFMFHIQEKMMMNPLIITLGDEPKWYQRKGYKLSKLDIWGEFAV